ncbi:hypothetical protein GNP84_06645 [Aliivibrio fischeri]|uniref:hypothetical protein n=1 Tax=Aliivibrio fischeri TaxID=668 RepID=UPI0012D87F0E|nr:hypothetical protein [Aliivibrio fischeri]MUK76584.1 hypothetical protein [Aliivibrio fischeri]
MNTKKKISYAIFGLIVVAMMESMAMDLLPKPQRQRQLAPPPVVATSVVTSPSRSFEQSKVTPTIKTTAQPLILELSDNAEAVMTALNGEYLSTIKTKALTAEILETEEQVKRDKLVHEVTYGPSTPTPTRVVNTTPKKTTPSIIERVKVNSIIDSTVYLDVSGQLLSVKKGDVVEDARVKRISRNAVIFTRKGKSFTKYIQAAPIKMATKKDSENAKQ